MLLKNPNFNYQVEPEEKIDLTPLLEAIYEFQKVVKSLDFPDQNDSVEVTNLDKIQWYLHKELPKAIQPIIDAIGKIKFPDQKDFPKSIEVTNFPKQEVTESVKVSNLNELKDYLEGIVSSIREIQIIVPPVNVQTPDVYVPTPNVTVHPNVNVNLREVVDALEPLQFISNKASSPISVRISDGNKFIKAVKDVAKSAERMAFSVTDGSALRESQLRTVMEEGSGFQLPRFDYLERSLTAADQETYVYKRGGSSGTTVATVVINYTDATLETILNVTRT